ncbi:NfeD family protein [Microbulbifer yueqingensis]|uniref:Membrane-bound serine protease (ClpP class) n=1 Tax=Microbulbifer yueqingensis TaxID=658219 RepID=A0A1G8X1N1_9GAMM|nr:nodulation protein NfeD [Microbulbifer yueqingensis]SDJ84559.1 membrane-bound serine protease (ClpP class) [Microbulbifer yueqingensis]
MLKRSSGGFGCAPLQGLLLVLFSLCASVATGQDVAEEAGDVVVEGPHVARFTIEGAIGPATTDYLVRAMEEAGEKGAQLFLIRMDTPGGLDAATRDIIKHILASPIPVVTYVHPSGSRAASAGTYILYASHIAAMTPATTLGAATPVQVGGAPGQPQPGQQPDKGEGDSSGSGEEDSKGTEKQDGAPQPGSAMERKVVNDSVAYIRGLANRHGRNADWAEKAVREAATLTAGEALEQNVIDIVATDQDDLLQQLGGRKVKLETGEVTIDEKIAEMPVQAYEPDWRNELLALITNPQVAYILLLVGIYGLIFEGYNPGALVPGIVGAICLLLAFYALQVLPINYAGLALIILGALLIVAEVFMPSFGALGIGGVIALVIGSVMLIDSDVPGMQVSRKLIGAIAGVSGLMLLGLLTAVGRSLRKPRVAADQALVGRPATVTEVTADEVLVRVGGEIWTAHADEQVKPGQRVIITEQHRLKLRVRPE